jgi:uncharacterized MAPEG superfamily protein
MTTILACWAVGIALPYIWAGASVPFRNRQFGAVDIQQPRVQGEQLSDAGARAVGAQANAWEALIVLTAANGAAIWAGVDPAGTWSTLAVVWVVARVLHGAFYIAGVAVGRVAAFATGLAMSIWILILAFSV